MIRNVYQRCGLKGCSSHTGRRSYGTNKQAKTLKLIEENPLADLKFSEFIDAAIAIKDAKVRPEHVKSIIESLSKHDDVSQALIVMMLAHGTRIGETRQARWDHIDFDSREWFIPSEHTKTKSAHRLPLTDEMIRYLQQYRASQKSDSVFLFPSARKRDSMSAGIATRLSGVFYIHHRGGC